MDSRDDLQTWPHLELVAEVRRLRSSLVSERTEPAPAAPDAAGENPTTADRPVDAAFFEMFDGIDQLAWMARPDGFIYWYNRRWYEYTGTTPADMEGWGWQSVHDPALLTEVMEGWRASIASGAPFDMEFPLKGADGTFRWFLTRVQPFRDDAGRVLHWFGTNTDIERLRQSEEAVRAAAEERERLFQAERAARSEAERQSRMKDEFLATLSHELRTPLNAILGWSQILGRGDTAAAQVRDGLAVIERNARVQTRIIEDLLDMSRIVSGKIRLDVQRIDLLSVIEGAIESVRPAADAKGIRLHKVLDPLAGPVPGDPARLQQVVWNLLSNAVKFTDRGGKVQVLLERVNSHLEISVSDNGQGIKPEFLIHVFDKFRQADASTTRRAGGLGLGLSIVRHLVELHGGQVRAKSAGEGKGATFIVLLPLSIAHQDDEDRRHPAAPATTPDLTDDCPPQLEGISILVVDDEMDARELARRILTDCGAVVYTAGSADEAEAALDQHRPNVLVSDIGMPGRDGYDLIHAVRRRLPHLGGVVPAVAVTAFARSEDRRRALTAGFDMHVSKPVEPAELLAVIGRLAQRGRS